MLVLSGYRTGMANAANGTCAGPGPPEFPSEMAAGIAFVVLILALVFAAVEAVLYVARRSDRG